MNIDALTLEELAQIEEVCFNQAQKHAIEYLKSLEEIGHILNLLQDYETDIKNAYKTLKKKGFTKTQCYQCQRISEYSFLLDEHIEECEKRNEIPSKDRILKIIKHYKWLQTQG